MKTKKLIDELSWSYLKAEFIIKLNADNSVKIDELTAAIEDGTIMARVRKCADELHNGDVYAVLANWSRVLSSMKTNMGYRVSKGYFPQRKVEELRYTILRNFVSSEMAKIKAAVNGTAKPYWQWTLEEIEAIPVSNIKLAASIYNTMQSKKSKYPEVVAEIPDFEVRMKAASAKYSAAKRAEKAGMTGSLVEKLAKGGVTTLSEDEVKQLQNLLKQLNK